VAAADRQSARQLDPTAYLEGHGYTVRREGRHLSVRIGGDEVYRMTRRHDGCWLWCDRRGAYGGDNIDLVREIEPGTSYAEAVYRLLGMPTVLQRPSEPPKRQPPQLPAQGPAARERGRIYLQSRGISQDTIDYAERAGMVRYADGGVLFVGYDDAGRAQNITRRAVSPDDPVQKRDLRGSDKSYPPILPGDPAVVWIVEGGVDALALHDFLRRVGERERLPTVIVSGGAHVRSFLEREHVQSILRQAESVVVVGENEKDPETQAKTDEGHQKQAQRVAEITGREARQWKPPSDAKDLAELNYLRVKLERELERRQQVEQVELDDQLDDELVRQSPGGDVPSCG